MGVSFVEGLFRTGQKHRFTPFKMVVVAEENSRMTGDWVSGPETLTEEELGAKRHIFTKNVWQTN